MTSCFDFFVMLLCIMFFFYNTNETNIVYIQMGQTRGYASRNWSSNSCDFIQSHKILGYTRDQSSSLISCKNSNLGHPTPYMFFVTRPISLKYELFGALYFVLAPKIMDYFTKFLKQYLYFAFTTCGRWKHKLSNSLNK